MIIYYSIPYTIQSVNVKLDLIESSLENIGDILLEQFVNFFVHSTLLLRQFYQIKAFKCISDKMRLSETSVIKRDQNGWWLKLRLHFFFANFSKIINKITLSSNTECYVEIRYVKIESVFVFSRSLDRNVIFGMTIYCIK